MAASHDSLRDDFEVSCTELDIMVEIARKIGRNLPLIFIFIVFRRFVSNA
jgi:hypothetical protein